MNPLPITARQIVLTILIFIGVVIGFGVLSGAIGWPGPEDWRLAVLVALVIALLPLVGPLLKFFQESGAIVDIRGVKLDFSQAPHLIGTEPPNVNLQEYPDLEVNDSNASSIADAAAAAIDAEIIVVNLGTGRSWYQSRLFTLAAAAYKLGGAGVIVLLKQNGGLDRYLLGWLHPKDIILAMSQENPEYEIALKRAEEMMEILKLNARSTNYSIPQEFLEDSNRLNTVFREKGDLALVPALINELKKPISGPVADNPVAPIESAEAPKWLKGFDADRLFEPWLIRERVTAGILNPEDRKTLVRVPHRFVAMEKNGQYAGMVDIDAFVRQLVLRSAKSS